jgi:hypothetical protein
MRILAMPTSSGARFMPTSHRGRSGTSSWRKIDGTLRQLSVAERRNHAVVGRALGYNTLMIGTVTEYRERYLGLYSDVAVGAQVELIRAEDGERLWEGRHVAISRAGGLPISPPAVIQGAVRALTNLGGEQFDRFTDDLARRLVSALPAQALPRSENVANSGSAGDRVFAPRHRDR